MRSCVLQFVRRGRLAVAVGLVVGCVAAPAPSVTAHAPRATASTAPPPPSASASARVGSAPPACSVARALVAMPTLDLDAAVPRLESKCGAGDSLACAWLGWTLEARVRDAATGSAADAWESRAAGGLDLGVCEGQAARTCSGVTSGMGCCDRGIRSCPDGCEAACHDARAAFETKTIGTLDAACKANRALACHAVGMIYGYGAAVSEIGNLVEGDVQRARDRFARGCELGLGLSCFQLASALENSDVPSENAMRIEQLEQRACDLGAGPGCLALGLRFAKRGAAASARAYEKKACALGMPLVCRDLASTTK
ncbi:MAG TPA: hypothetical protein VGH28_29245 [Polyangiaceae bacterium]